MKELVYRSNGENFFLNKVNIDMVFKIMDKTDYLFLYGVKKGIENANMDNAVFLSDLAEDMNISISAMSRIAHRLHDQGYITWDTDPEKERTFVTLTKKGMELIAAQRELLMETYRLICQEITEEEMETTITTMLKISDIIEKCI